MFIFTIVKPVGSILGRRMEDFKSPRAMRHEHEEAEAEFHTPNLKIKTDEPYGCKDKEVAFHGD
jgi:hypothetical protein